MSTFQVFEGSASTVPSETMIFNNIFQSTGVDKIEMTEIHPVSNLIDQSPIDFNIDSIGTYTDTRLIKIKFSFKIVHDTGEDIDVVTPVTCINLPLASAFSQVDVLYNQKLVSSTGQLYSYKGYFDTFLSYGVDAKTSQLQSWMYYRDTPWSHDTTDNLAPAQPINLGAIARQQLTLGSNEVEVVGPLFCDALMLSQWMLNSVSIRIRLWPTKNNFRLIAPIDGNYKMLITKASLLIPRVHLSSSIISSHGEQLKENVATYPYMRSELRTCTLAAGLQSYNLVDMFQRSVPDKLCLAFVSSRAFNGDIDANAFNFHHFNVNFLGLSIGNSYVPSAPLTPVINADNRGQYTECYNSLYTFDSKLQMDRGLDLGYSEYLGGYFICVFDLTSNIKHDGPNIISLQQMADLKLELRFREPLLETIVVIIYGTFPGVIQVDQSRNVNVT